MARQLSSPGAPGSQSRLEALSKAAGKPSPSRAGHVPPSTSTAAVTFSPNVPSEGERARRSRKRAHAGPNSKGKHRARIVGGTVEKEIVLLSSDDFCAPKRRRRQDVSDEGRQARLVFSTSDDTATLLTLAADLFSEVLDLQPLYCLPDDLEFVKATANAVYVPDQQPSCGKDLLELAGQGRIYVRVKKPNGKPRSSATGILSLTRPFNVNVHSLGRWCHMYKTSCFNNIRVQVLLVSGVNSRTVKQA